jgi:hypothetical protein
MADKYEINDPTPGETVTLEQEAEKLPEEVPSGDRPEWLPEKFKTPEDLASAYSNLEQKLGSEENKEEKADGEDLPPTEETDTTPADNAVAEASDEWSEKGSLSDDTYKSLEGVGLSRDMVDTYIQGQEALQLQQQDEIISDIGTREDYQKMSDWASDALTSTQLDAYNKAVESGGVHEAKMAVDWLKGKYESANGVSPTLVQGRTTGATTSPFESRAQVLSAMAERDARGKKKYEVDPAYRAEVARRLSVSPNL